MFSELLAQLRNKVCGASYLIVDMSLAPSVVFSCVFTIAVSEQLQWDGVDAEPKVPV